MEQELERPAWLEIKMKALAKNYKFIRSKLNKKLKLQLL